MYRIKFRYPMRFIPIVAVACLVLLSVTTSSVDQVQAAAPTDVDLAGTFEAVQGEMVRLKDSQGNFTVAMIDPRGSTINYRGKVDRAMLKPGTFVRFSAPAASEGNFLSPLGEVELYVPKPEVMNRRASPAEMSRTHPGIYKMALISPAAPGLPVNPDVRVVGQIISIEESSMALQCGDSNLKLEIESDMRVVINAPTLQWAQSGDQIYGKGAFNSSGQLVIRSLTVTGTKTLGTEQAGAAGQAPVADKKMTAKEKAKAKKEAALAKKNKKLLESKEADTSIEAEQKDEPK